MAEVEVIDINTDSNDDGANESELCEERKPQLKPPMNGPSVASEIDEYLDQFVDCHNRLIALGPLMNQQQRQRWTQYLSLSQGQAVGSPEEFEMNRPARRYNRQVATRRKPKRKTRKQYKRRAISNGTAARATPRTGPSVIIPPRPTTKVDRKPNVAKLNASFQVKREK